MTTRRANPYLHATWVAKALVGDKSCLWAYWFKANNQGFAKVPSTFDSARWNMEHTQLLDELAAKLEVQGCQVFIERQNDFRVESRRSGVVISGTPDIIAIHPDGRAVIYDVKTGQPSASHTAQVQLYMYLVPRARDSRLRGTTFEGKVVYRDDREVKLPSSSVDSEFIAKVTAFVRQDDLASAGAPRAQHGGVWLVRSDQRRLPQARGVRSRVENLKSERRNESHAMIVKITSKSQVTLPARILDAMGVVPGDTLELIEAPDGYLLRPRRIDYSRLGTLKGRIPEGRPSFDIHAFRDSPYDPALRD